MKTTLETKIDGVSLDEYGEKYGFKFVDDLIYVPIEDADFRDPSRSNMLSARAVRVGAEYKDIADEDELERFNETRLWWEADNPNAENLEDVVSDWDNVYEVTGDNYDDLGTVHKLLLRF